MSPLAYQITLLRVLLSIVAFLYDLVSTVLWVDRGETYAGHTAFGYTVAARGPPSDFWGGAVHACPFFPLAASLTALL